MINSCTVIWHRYKWRCGAKQEQEAIIRGNNKNHSQQEKLFLYWLMTKEALPRFLPNSVIITDVQFQQKMSDSDPLRSKEKFSKEASASLVLSMEWSQCHKRLSTGSFRSTRPSVHRKLQTHETFCAGSSMCPLQRRNVAQTENQRTEKLRGASGNVGVESHRQCCGPPQCQFSKGSKWEGAVVL